MTMEQSEIQEYTDEVAKILNETEEKPVRQIRLMVEHLGREWVAKMLEETHKIEEKGGMKIENRKRRRTIGGVFFYISKGKMTDEQRALVFPHSGPGGKVVKWEERHDYVDKLMDKGEHGKMRHVNITLSGRPGEVIEEDHSIITTISHVHKKTPMPKGVPNPPEDPVIYTVYMSKRHWNEVVESLNEFKGDRLIVEGTVTLDNDTETIAVHAIRVSTRRLEKAAQQSADANQKNEKTGKAEKKDQADKKPKATAPSKLEKLYSAAEKLRERITDMEAKGQRGVNMTKQLLRNTEKQIEALEKSQSS